MGQVTFYGLLANSQVKRAITPNTSIQDFVRRMQAEARAAGVGAFTIVSDEAPVSNNTPSLTDDGAGGDGGGGGGFVVGE